VSGRYLVTGWDEEGLCVVSMCKATFFM